MEDVRSYPSVGRNTYNEKEVLWFEATYEYLEDRLDDAERAKRMLPAKKPRRAGRSAASAPAAPPPVAAVGPMITSRAAPRNDTEDDDESVFVTPESRKRGRKTR